MAAILISPGFFWILPECEAQNRIASPEYDYYSLAITSISDSEAEASKLSDIPQRVKLLINAARILGAAKQNEEAVRLLEVALRDLKEWGSADKANWRQRNTAAALSNEILAVYALVDPEKAVVRQKEFQAAAESTASNSSVTSPKSENWYRQFIDRRTIADQAAKIALSLIDTDPEKALGLIVQSLQGGIVSGVLFDIVQKLIQTGNRAFLNKLEIGIGQVLAANFTLDPSSLTGAQILVLADKDMPSAARSAFVSFFMGSLQAWSNLLKEPGIDTFYISVVFTAFSRDVRPILLQYSPEQLLALDLVLDQVAPLVPEKTKSRIQAFQPETFSDPRERLSDILRDPAPEKRDLRLVRLVSELLRNQSEDFQKRFDFASDAISGFSDPDVKSAFTDLLTITRVNALVKQKKFIEAQRLASSISSEETRAWALLALSRAAAKVDRVLGFELVSNAMKALDTASPSPHKVELALRATAMLAKNDPQRAFDTFSAASRYANSSAAKIDPPTKPAVAFGLEATIGEAHTRLGVYPESLGEVQIDPSLSLLGITNWFRADQIASDIRDPSLRLRLKLQFAGAVLAQDSNSKRKQATPKPVVKD
ncbi:MAG: hypothetical protein ABJC05_07185 [Pyrinomonadaceae bacterium]